MFDSPKLLGYVRLHVDSKNIGTCELAGSGCPYLDNSTICEIRYANELTLDFFDDK